MNEDSLGNEAGLGREDSLALEEEQRARLIWNERTKIEALFLNTLGLTIIGIGTVTPIVGLLYGLTSAPSVPIWEIAAVAVTSAIAGIGLNWAATNWLEQLE